MFSINIDCYTRLTIGCTLLANHYRNGKYKLWRRSWTILCSLIIELSNDTGTFSCSCRYKYWNCCWVFHTVTMVSTLLFLLMTNNSTVFSLFITNHLKSLFYSEWNLVYLNKNVMFTQSVEYTLVSHNVIQSFKLLSF